MILPAPAQKILQPGRKPGTLEREGRPRMRIRKTAIALVMLAALSLSAGAQAQLFLKKKPQKTVTKKQERVIAPEAKGPQTNEDLFGPCTEKDLKNLAAIDKGLKALENVDALNMSKEAKQMLEYVQAPGNAEKMADLYVRCMDKAAAR